VAELVDALASGASGLTAVKVRVLSWAPLLPVPMIWLNAGLVDPLTGAQNRDIATVTYRMACLLQRFRFVVLEFQDAGLLRQFGQDGRLPGIVCLR
jgi:hypothetical protein